MLGPETFSNIYYLQVKLFPKIYEITENEMKSYFRFSYSTKTVQLQSVL